ncbi:unnamed protein product [Rotaria sp. Silwood1]|nr:unnamed protein product [Rotaria sp. Silwood1]CAF3373996.1 unnamed protein product [Rotaria sp. Silwood1]CAF3382319.1 unnamed protein product [Rotaria sp. Silwood1]CAF4730156.1 unnamed protein product [Rotaria sp. Silwood1]CAF4927730.1 unnamed protein product [Rotaria sp. Silwood1]
MTTTLIIERSNNHRCSFPLEETQSTYKKSYFKFYQHKLRQLLTENRYRQEHYIKYSKKNRVKTQFNHKLLHKEYMNHIGQTMKMRLQNDNYGKKPTSVLSIANRRNHATVSVTITSTSISTTNTIISTEFAPKSILKTKQPSSLSKSQRVSSAPTNNEKGLRKKVLIKLPTIEINCADDDDSDDDDRLSKSNAYSYTQISSSSQNDSYNNHQYARKSVLNTIMLHLNSNTPPDVSKWDLYRDFDDKFSASISPTVYRNFERIIL